MSSKHLPIAQLEERKINLLESSGSISNRIDINAPLFINAHFQLIVINDLWLTMAAQWILWSWNQFSTPGIGGAQTYGLRQYVHQHGFSWL